MARSDAHLLRAPAEWPNVGLLSLCGDVLGVEVAIDITRTKHGVGEPVLLDS